MAKNQRTLSLKAGGSSNIRTVFLAIAGIMVTDASRAQEASHLTPTASDAQDKRCVDFAKQHPDYHFVQGGPSPCLFATAPLTFDPETASDYSLETWGLPRRPTLSGGQEDIQNYKSRYAQWRALTAALMDPKKHRTSALTCTIKAADFKGPSKYWKLCRIENGKFHDSRIIPDHRPAGSDNSPSGVTAPESNRGVNHSDATPPFIYMPTVNVGGYLVTFPSKPNLGGGGGSSVFQNMAAAPPVITFAQVMAQCRSAKKAGLTTLSVSSWIGFEDTSSPTALDQVGTVSNYYCSEESYSSNLFAEEPPGPQMMPDPPCSVQPGDSASGQINTIEYGYGGYLFDIADGSCSFNGMLGGVGDSNQSTGQGAIVGVELQYGSSIYPAGSAILPARFGQAYASGFQDGNIDEDFGGYVNAVPPSTVPDPLQLYYLQADNNSTTVYYQPDTAAVSPNARVIYTGPAP